MISLKPFFKYLAGRQSNCREASERTGISYPTMCRMKKTNKFNTKDIEKICNAYDLPIKEVMRYEED